MLREKHMQTYEGITLLLAATSACCSALQPWRDALVEFVWAEMEQRVRRVEIAVSIGAYIRQRRRLESRLAVFSVEQLIKDVMWQLLDGIRHVHGHAKSKGLVPCSVAFLFDVAPEDDPLDVWSR